MNLVQIAEKREIYKKRGYRPVEYKGFFYIQKPDGKLSSRSKSNIDAIDSWKRFLTGVNTV